MAGVREFLLPDLGEGLTEAEVVRWLVQVGDVVGVDQPVVEVETAKAVVEVPCPYRGVVTARFGEEGEFLDVGRPLLTIATGDAPGAGAAAPSGEASGDGSGNVLVGYGTASPAARRRRVRVRATAPDGGGAGGARSNGGPVAVISPLVRRIAREHGVDLRALAGSGPEGLILRADVERAIAPAAPHAPAPAPAPVAVHAAAPAADGSRIPLRGMRAPSRTSSAAAGGRSRTPPAGWTPTPPNCSRCGPR